MTTPPVELDLPPLELDASEEPDWIHTLYPTFERQYGRGKERIVRRLGERVQKHSPGGHGHDQNLHGRRGQFQDGTKLPEGWTVETETSGWRVSLAARPEIRERMNPDNPEDLELLKSVFGEEREVRVYRKEYGWGEMRVTTEKDQDAQPGFKDTIQTLDTLGAKYPPYFDLPENRTMKVGFGPLMGEDHGGFTLQGLGNMNLSNTHVLAEGAAPVRTSVWASGNAGSRMKPGTSTAQYIVAHEWGHAISTGSMQEKLVFWATDNVQSAYGRLSPSEAYAEAFAVHIFGTDESRAAFGEGIREAGW